MTYRRLAARIATALTLAATMTGCAAAKRAPDAAGPAVMAEQPKPQVLDHSLYAKNATGSLSEAQLQEILRKPIDLQFPARVGVVPLAEPFDPAKPVSVATRNVAARHLSKSLIGSPQFSHVSDISTELPKPGGIEGLRVLAARYRVRYLLLYTERFEDDTHSNGWAALYPTGLGMFFAPGVTVESHGVAQVDLLDVRTGTILYSVVEPMHVSSQEWMVGAARAHRELQAAEAADTAGKLAKRVSSQANALVAFADSAAKGDEYIRTRILPAAIAVDQPQRVPAPVQASDPPQVPAAVQADGAPLQ